jgi:hypothetical protein
MEHGSSDPHVANAAQRATRRNRRAPPPDESYEHEVEYEDSNTPHNPKGTHSLGQIGRSFSARSRGQPEGNLNYTTRKPVPPSASELSEESTTPRGLPTDSYPESSTAMPGIQVSSPPPAPGVSSPPARSNTARSGSANDSRRDWASDRSPLQKLEVTLSGISKEEKRARVQEAEIKARERIARKKAEQEKAELAAAVAREASAQHAQQAIQLPSSAGRRNERKDRDLPADGNMRNGHANARQQRQPGNTAARHTRAVSTNPQYPAIRRPEEPQFTRAAAAIPSSVKMGSVPKRSVTVSGPAKPGPTNNIVHSRSMSQAASRPIQAPSAFRAEKTSDLLTAPFGPQDSSESQSKPKNVSFDVPPPTPPPIFEWRGAQPARLGAADFDFQNLDIHRSKAWWEGGGNKDRRKSRALPKNYQTPAQKLTGKIFL